MGYKDHLIIKYHQPPNNYKEKGQYSSKTIQWSVKVQLWPELSVKITYNNTNNDLYHYINLLRDDKLIKFKQFKAINQIIKLLKYFP